jgi:signal transduction histidine kinase
MNPQLAALAVHGLKNALGALEGQLVALEFRLSPEQARRARLHCERLRRQMVAFLTLYRADEMRAMVDDESPTDLLEALAAAARDSAQVAVDVCPCETAPPFWHYDARLVELALDAALHNACRYAKRRVVLDAAERDGYLVFTIDDDGPGLGATEGDAWSTGLGTELCKAVAQAHRNGVRVGRIELGNRPQGGARFELMLP